MVNLYSAAQLISDKSYNYYMCNNYYIHVSVKLRMREILLSCSDLKQEGEPPLREHKNSRAPHPNYYCYYYYYCCCCYNAGVFNCISKRSSKRYMSLNALFSLSTFLFFEHAIWNDSDGFSLLVSVCVFESIVLSPSLLWCYTATCLWDRVQPHTLSVQHMSCNTHAAAAQLLTVFKSK